MSIQRFGVTSGHSRKGFRSLRKKPEETYAQVACKLDWLLKQWLEKTDSCQDVINLIGLEQFLKILPTEYCLLVQDKESETVAKAAEIMDKLVLMRGGKYF